MLVTLWHSEPQDPDSDPDPDPDPGFESKTF
jgi:hypothetical protein